MSDEIDLAGYVAGLIVLAAAASLVTFALSWSVPPLEPLRLLSFVLLILEVLGAWAWGRYSRRFEE